MVVCRRRCAASLAGPNMEPGTCFFGPAPDPKKARPFVGASPSTTHNQAGPTRVRARNRAFYVRSNFRTFTGAGWADVHSAPMCQPCPSLREVACACSALARHCARSLWRRGTARALPTRACAAPRWRHSLRALWKGTARARSRRSFGARPVLPRASPAPHFARWLARVAHLRATALALSGDEAQHARFRRARALRRAGQSRFVYYGMLLHQGDASPPSVQHRAPSGQPLSPVRSCATELALCGDEAQHMRVQRARAPRRAARSWSVPLGGHCTSEPPRPLSVQGVSDAGRSKSFGEASIATQRWRSAAALGWLHWGGSVEENCAITRAMLSVTLPVVSYAG